MEIGSASELVRLRLSPRGNLVFSRQVFNGDGSLRSIGCGVRYRGNDTSGHVEASGVGVLAVVGDDRLFSRMP